MTGEFEERFDNADVAFIDGDMQRSLATFIAGVQVGTALS